MASVSPSSIDFAPVQMRPLKSSGESLRRVAAPLADDVDELLVDLADQRLRVLDLPRLERARTGRGTPCSRRR